MKGEVWTGMERQAERWERDGENCEELWRDRCRKIVYVCLWCTPNEGNEYIQN